jgi:hypothetical protein
LLFLPERVALSLLADCSEHPVVKTDRLEWEPWSRLRVTLWFLGSMEDVESAKTALASVRAAPVPCAIGRRTDRFGNTPVHGLDELAVKVTTETKDIGQPSMDRAFSTMSRWRVPTAPQSCRCRTSRF